MTNFKVGDKLRCIREFQWREYSINLEYDSVNTVKNLASNGDVSFDGINYWGSNRFELVKENKQMKKSDLKSGMKVITRSGEQYIVFVGATSNYTQHHNDDIWFVNPIKEVCSWFSGASMAEDMTYGSHWDIMEVLVPGHPYDVFYHTDGFTSVWKREEKSEAQIQLEKLQEQIAQLTKEADTLKGMLK